MGKPITLIAKEESTQEQLKSQTLDRLVDDLSNHSDGLRQGMELLQELHDSGILDIAVALLQAKEKVAKIALDQVGRQPVTNMINHVVAAASAISETEPDTTKKIVKCLSNGMAQAEASLEMDNKVRPFQLLKMLRDPDINRSIIFGLNLLKGIGEGLKD